MIKAIIFDCFGVLYGGSLGILAAMAAPEHHQEIYDINQAKDYGYISYPQYLQQIGDIVGRPPEDIDAVMSQHHIANTWLIDYAQSLRGSYKVGLLSNIGDQTMERLFDGKVESLFDEVVLSYREGIAKPSPEIFALMAERLAVAPGECIMIDDLMANCEGAEIAGMQSILHTDNQLTQQYITELTQKTV